LIAAIFSVALLVGCKPEMRTACPPLKRYSAAKINAVAKQYRFLPAVVRDWLSDYRLLRRQCDSLA
jgi:outer membrane murein-binding lipoprotein Lpp